MTETEIMIEKVKSALDLYHEARVIMSSADRDLREGGCPDRCRKQNLQASAIQDRADEMIRSLDMAALRKADRYLYHRVQGAQNPAFWT